MDVDSLMKEVVSCILPEDGLKSTPETKETEVQPPTAEFHIRRKSWHEADLTMVEEDENVVKSHRHSLSAEAVLLSVPGSVVEKVKMFTELAVVSTATVQTDRPTKSEGSKDLHVAGGNSLSDSAECLDHSQFHSCSCFTAALILSAV
jgi:hypothetical protein